MKVSRLLKWKIGAASAIDDVGNYLFVGAPTKNLQALPRTKPKQTSRRFQSVYLIAQSLLKASFRLWRQSLGGYVIEVRC